jgi:ligand-binding sensor domain-containing protein
VIVEGFRNFSKMEIHFMHIRYNIFQSFASCLLFVIFLTGCSKDKTPETTFALPSEVIHKIAVDKNGTKWIATSKGIVCFDGEKWNPYPDIPLENNSIVRDLSISPSTGNEIWLAGNSGVSFLKFNAADILSSGSFSAQENGLLSNEVSAIVVDVQNTKYIGTSMGISIYANNQWSEFIGRPTEEILRDFQISSIAVAKNGWIYASTSGGGVSRFKYPDAISGATTYDSIWTGIRSNYVNTVIIVEDSCQWYGTNHGAAFHTSHHAKIGWTQYTIEDGLISDTVLSIAKDFTGNIWFGTNIGVSRLSGTQWTNFTSDDGLADNHINTISVDKDSSIWFGTNNGISHFKNNSWVKYTHY